MPASQSEHSTVRLVAVKVPGLQARHELWSTAPLKRPLGQSWQPTPPAKGWNSPSWHTKQLKASEALEKRPGAQLSQAVCESEGLKVPASQTRQLDCPGEAWEEPAAQGLQLEEALREQVRCGVVGEVWLRAGNT